MAHVVIANGLWRWLKNPGLERFELVQKSREWVLCGTIVTQADSGAAEAHYEISCDVSFRTRKVNVMLHDARGERSLQVMAKNGRWYHNGREEASVHGAIDVDLGWSPSTNTLPIRRLKLKVGESSGEFVAAWIRFPELTLEPLPQQYSRVADCKYRYSSQRGAFTADLTVDAHGLVIDYEGFWERVAR